MDIKDYMRALGDLAAPRFCVVCGRRLSLEERQICRPCRGDIPYTYNWTMPHNPMADRYNECVQRHVEAALDKMARNDSDTEPAEESLPDVPEPYAYAAALFFYRSGSSYREITKALKYHSNLDAGRMFASVLAAHLADSKQFADVDLVLPVPLHWTRQWSRGYNQAEVIAKVIAAELGHGSGKCVCKRNLLRRRRRTKTQTHLSVADKRRNVYHAFTINRRAVCRLEADRVPAHILLVDDVFTTGSTLSECHRALREVFGPEIRISVATLACIGG